MIIIVVYVDYIIFGRNIDNLSQSFVEHMQINLRCMYWERCHSFLLKISQSKQGLFISQTKHIKQI